MIRRTVLTVGVAENIISVTIMEWNYQRLKRGRYTEGEELSVTRAPTVRGAMCSEHTVGDNIMLLSSDAHKEGITGD